MEYVHNSNTHPMLHCIFNLTVRCLTYIQADTTDTHMYIRSCVHACTHTWHKGTLPGITHLPCAQRWTRRKNVKQKNGPRIFATYPDMAMSGCIIHVYGYVSRTYSQNKSLFAQKNVLFAWYFLPGIITIPKNRKHAHIYRHKRNKMCLHVFALSFALRLCLCFCF